MRGKATQEKLFIYLFIFKMLWKLSIIEIWKVNCKFEKWIPLLFLLFYYYIIYLKVESNNFMNVGWIINNYKFNYMVIESIFKSEKNFTDTNNLNPVFNAETWEILMCSTFVVHHHYCNKQITLLRAQHYLKTLTRPTLPQYLDKLQLIIL